VTTPRPAHLELGVLLAKFAKLVGRDAIGGEPPAGVLVGKETIIQQVAGRLGRRFLAVLFDPPPSQPELPQDGSGQGR